MSLGILISTQYGLVDLKKTGHGALINQAIAMSLPIAIFFLNQLKMIYLSHKSLV
jgi:hypothetical protein